KLRLSARHLAVKLRVPKQRRALVELSYLRRLAMSEKLLLAHVAVAAGDVEGDDHAVARFDMGHLRADLFHDSHRLVAEDVALVDERPEHLVQMEIRSTDRARRGADHGVGRFADGGI